MFAASSLKHDVNQRVLNIKMTIPSIEICRGKSICVRKGGRKEVEAHSRPWNGCTPSRPKRAQESGLDCFQSRFPSRTKCQFAGRYHIYKEPLTVGFSLSMCRSRRTYIVQVHTDEKPKSGRRESGHVLTWTTYSPASRSTSTLTLRDQNRAGVDDVTGAVSPLRNTTKSNIHLAGPEMGSK